MVSRRAVLPGLAALVLISACTAAEGGSPMLLPTEASLAKPPSGLTDPSATFKLPTSDPTVGLRGDGLYPSADTSVYAHGVCGVNAKIFATAAASNSGDAIMHTNNPKFSDRKCTVYPRTVTVDYGDGVVETAPVFINVREIASTTFQIPIGSTVQRILRVDVGGRCDGLAWADQLANGTSTNGGDRVNVTRVDASTWLVETQPDGENQAYCVNSGELFQIPVRFTVVSSSSLP